MTRRGLIALAWLAGSAAPLLLAVVWVGCCALPLHGVVHRLLPLCDMAERSLAAGHAEHGAREAPATPAPQREAQDGPRLAWKREARVAALPPLVAGPLARVSPPIGCRSQLAPGALRCDDDVGTRLSLLDTLRI